LLNTTNNILPSRNRKYRDILLAATLGAVISFYVRSSSILEICFMDEMKYTGRRQRKIK